jgi:DNA invertase Pin-like site-specific DNA recombinase
METSKSSKKVALLYTRVSTSMQVNDGMSLAVQERALKKAASDIGYKKTELLREEGRSGKSIKGRPVLSSALERLDRGEAEALIVTRVDRLARSTQDFLSIIDRANKNNWRVVMLDLNLDTSTYQGRFVVTIMSALAEMERAIIAERQKDVHKDRRANGVVWGKDKGPKTKIPAEVLNVMTQWRASGISYSEIARKLNELEVSTSNGGKKWYASSVSHVLLKGKHNKVVEPGP